VADEYVACIEFQTKLLRFHAGRHGGPPRPRVAIRGRGGPPPPRRRPAGMGASHAVSAWLRRSVGLRLSWSKRGAWLLFYAASPVSAREHCNSLLLQLLLVSFVLLLRDNSVDVLSQRLEK